MFTASIQMQKSEGGETIVNISILIHELLVEFEKPNKAMPRNLIVFRIPTSIRYAHPCVDRTQLHVSTQETPQHPLNTLHKYTDFCIYNTNPL